MKYVRQTARFNGKKYEATGKTELEAMTKLAEKISAAKRGEEVIAGSMTVNAWYKQWKTLYKNPKGLTEKSLGMYDEKYNGYIKHRIRHMKLRDVKDVHLQRILNEQAGMSKSHVEKLRRVMRELFSRARKSRLIVYDPSEDLTLPAVKDGSHRSITDEERAVILAVAEGHPAGLWILTLLYTGMRPGEAAALNWADIDFKRAMNIHMGVKVVRNKLTDDLVAKDLTMYCLRHTFATDCARVGIPLGTVRWLMGHSDISTTANIYQHQDNKVLHNAISILDGTAGAEKISTTFSTT